MQKNRAPKKPVKTGYPQRKNRFFQKPVYFAHPYF
jgi:hypothetical protein